MYSKPLMCPLFVFYSAPIVRIYIFIYYIVFNEFIFGCFVEEEKESAKIQQDLFFGLYQINF